MADTVTPAFPIPINANSRGMTLRDYFAAHALTAAERNLDFAEMDFTPQAIAKRAYAIADAMMEAREDGT